MKNIKLNNTIRRFMTIAYIFATLAGTALGLIPENKWWLFISIPIAVTLLLFLVSLINIWVEHRYVTFPYERNVQIALDANRQLNKEKEQLKKELYVAVDALSEILEWHDQEVKDWQYPESIAKKALMKLQK